MITPSKDPFDPNKEVYALKPITIGSANREIEPRVFAVGEPFDKTLVNTRRLRQLYDANYLTFEKPLKTTAPKPKASASEDTTRVRRRRRNDGRAA